MSPRLLVFQHIECEDPGTMKEFFADDGVEWHAVELDAGAPIPPLEHYDALWVMGGPMDVWDVAEYPWLVAEKQAIRRWVRELEKPFLGLCLGHQLLADALGGTCAAQRYPEIGILEVQLTPEGIRDPIFAGMPRNQKCLQWHSVCVVEPPGDAIVLAESDVCRVQAMRIGKHAWSMQYHIEVESKTVANWSAVPAYRQPLERTLGEDAVGRLEADAKTNMSTFRKNAERLYRNFMTSIS